VLLPIGWLAALAATLKFAVETCSAAEPCGPELGFSLAAVALFATPVLLWWIPRLGCVAGIVFGSLDAALDDVVAARYFWGAHALACLVVLVLLVRDITRQRLIATTGFTPGMPPVTRTLPEVVHLPRLGNRTRVACILVVACIGCLGLYWQQATAEERHLARAQEVTGTVTAVTDDGYGLTLTAAGAGTRQVDAIEVHRVGTEVPMLVDPVDAGWARLVAEPADSSYWLTIGLSALLLGLILGWRDRKSVRWAKIAVGKQLPARRVLIDSDGSKAYLYPTDAGPQDPPFALVRTWPTPPNPDQQLTDDLPGALDLEVVANFARAWRGEGREFPSHSIESGLVLGDLSTDGWIVVLAKDRVMFASRPVGVVRDWPEWVRPSRSSWPTEMERYSLSRSRRGLAPSRPSPELASPSEPASLPEFASPPEAGPRPRTMVNEPLPGNPVPAAGPVPSDLPRNFMLKAQTRRQGWLLLVGGLLTTVALKPVVDWITGDWWLPLVWGSFLTAGLTVRGWNSLTHRLTLEHTGAVIVATLHVYRVPWETLHGVRVTDAGDVALAWQPDAMFKAGPFEQAQEAAAAIATLRERALAFGVSGRGPTRRLRWGAVALHAGLILAFAAGWLLSG
jgi:hypothetical protein